MKFFIVVSCVFAAASAGILSPVSYHAGLVSPLAYAGQYLTHGYAGPLHIPVIGPNGVPLDTPEVAAGKVANAQAHIDAKARNADLTVVAPVASGLGVYSGPQHIPVIGLNGVPLDTPEVAAGKIANAQAHIDAKARNGNLAVVAPLVYSGPQHIPVIGPNGVPLNTPEVAAGIIANTNAHIDAKARNGDLVHYRARRGILGAAYSTYAAPITIAHAYPQHLPVIGANGVPLDTPEVAAGKVANAIVHAEAHARNGDYSIIAPLAYSGLAHGIVAPVAVSQAYAGPLHIPVIGPNGVPLDTPEVAAGKVANAQAHIDAKARNGASSVAVQLADDIVAPVAVSRAYTGPLHMPVIGPNGVPLDTPEVAAGKAANAKAHAEANARNADSSVVAQLDDGIVAPIAVAQTYIGPQHMPVIGPNGVPQDTPEVAAGKAANAQAHVEAKARNADLALVAPLAYSGLSHSGLAYSGLAHSGLAYPGLAYSGLAHSGLVYSGLAHSGLAYSRLAHSGLVYSDLAHNILAPYGYGYSGPQHIPVIGANGVPLDTPDVAAGKIANAQAHIEAKVRNGDLVLHY